MFVNSLENYGILKLVKNKKERRLWKKLEIVKIRNEDKNKLLKEKICFSNKDLFLQILTSGNHRVMADEVVYEM